MEYRLKKRYGQHFLHDENICRKIVAAVEQYPASNLLEIGPGGGALTKYLLNLPNIDFKAVEIDAEKVTFLLATYPTLAGRILPQDLLKIDPPFDEPFQVVGNFPYNISTEIVFKLVDWRHLLTNAVGMFQKEVAQRLAAKPGSKTYGITSVLTQAFFAIDYLFEVAPGCFTPPPKVNSAVIRMTPLISSPAMRSEADFKWLVKTAFGQRRKQLRNTLKDLFDADTLKDDFFTRRPETLSVEEFASLSFKMTEKSSRLISPPNK